MDVHVTIHWGESGPGSSSTTGSDASRRFQLANVLNASRLSLQKASWLIPLPACSAISLRHWSAVRRIRVVLGMICSWLSSGAAYSADSTEGRTAGNDRLRAGGDRRKARTHPGKPAADPGSAQYQSRPLHPFRQPIRQNPIQQFHRPDPENARTGPALRKELPQGPGRGLSAVQSRLISFQSETGILAEWQALACVEFGDLPTSRLEVRQESTLTLWPKAKVPA